MLMVSSGIVCAGPYEDARAAAERGDFATALRLWHLLAEQGNGNAQYNLGAMYGQGQGVPQDYNDAAKWFRLSAEQGDASAQNKLGYSYVQGQGVLQDYNEAAKWFRLSAEKGNIEAQHNLGLMYVEGKGVNQDYARAYMWFDGAAARGDAGAAQDRLKAFHLMTPKQLARAQDMAKQCEVKNFKNCD